MARDVLLRAAVLGASAGARSATPLAALAGDGGRFVRVLTVLAAGGELVVDKLPGTPSRLQPGPLAGRLVLGAVAGGWYARRRGRSVILPAVTAAAAAAGSSWAGARWRSVAARRGLAVPAALAEDGVAVSLAAVATRR
ncbi:hypothetical protein AB0J80_24435 [Actinoplanes sp. NPDC049548]|uniref:hypothetical protein n=1 Tax=Actinoplanes sp. NPDC049548 TaxID=3155152 RepID=UPI003422FC87